MYSDERRDPEIIQEQLRSYAIRNPEMLYEKLQERSEEAGRYRTELERNEARFRGEISSLEAQLEVVEKERKSLREKIDSERQKSQLQRRKLEKEVGELKSKLEGLRKSKTMRAGRVVALPWNLARKFKSLPKKYSSVAGKLRLFGQPGFLQQGRHSESKASVRNENERQDPDSKEIPPLADISVSSNNKSFDDRSLAHEEFPYITALRDEPEKKKLEEAIRKLWHEEGNFSLIRALLAEYPDFADELNKTGRVLKDRANGIHRLLTEEVAVPERSKGCAYVPEPGRIMYCVYSTPLYNSNGYSTRTRGVAKGIHGAGGDVVVVARAGYPWDWKTDKEKPELRRQVDELDNITYVHLPRGDMAQQSPDTYAESAANAFVQEALILRPSSIQAASNFKVALPALIAARRLGLPFVYEVRGLWEITGASTNPKFAESERFQAMKSLETRVAREADIVLAITNQVAEELIQRGVDRDKIRIAPNAVDPGMFEPLPKDSEFAQRVGFDPAVPTIGFAGSIVQYEGLETLLDASSHLAQQGVPHQIVIAGSGAAEKGLRAKKEQDALDNVIFLGRLPQEDIPRLMSTFDIVACPRLSQPVTELVSALKPLESFAAGKPTVLSDVGPNVDLAGVSEERAALFRAGDPHSLSATLMKLLNSPELREELGQAARDWAITERDWNSMGRGVLEAHREATSNFREKATRFIRLEDLNVGVMAQPMTLTALEQNFSVEPLSRSAWSRQLESVRLDFILVESSCLTIEPDPSSRVQNHPEGDGGDIRDLVLAAKQKGIPTVFWDVDEDRDYSETASVIEYFDHVCTASGSRSMELLKSRMSALKTVSPMPFFAEPRLHNPFTSAERFRNTIGLISGRASSSSTIDQAQYVEEVAGIARSYGIEKYNFASNGEAERLADPLSESSPARALTEGQAREAHKLHIAHVVVNSAASPSWFPRQMVEIPASGGVVLSLGTGETDETLGDALLQLKKPEACAAVLHDWSINPLNRLHELWFQMRSIHRSHTAASALTVLCRTIGIPVWTQIGPSYGLQVKRLSVSVAESIAHQSVLPTVVKFRDYDEDAASLLKKLGISLAASEEADFEEPDYWGVMDSVRSRTHFEDLLLPTRWDDWDFITAMGANEYRLGAPVVTRVVGLPAEVGLVRSSVHTEAREREPLVGVSLFLPES